MNILVCDDDVEIVEAISIYLGNEGYKILKAYDGQQCLEVLKEHEIHLIIMDIMMPKMDGMQATHNIRTESHIPIIMLSAKSEDMNKIMGLNMGADDYITKPFNPLELIARVKSQLRRYTKFNNFEEKQDVLKCDGLVLDDETKMVYVDDEPVKLTKTEYNILFLLMSNMGRVFSIDQIYEQVWHEEPINADNTVTVHIRKIREKIEINPKDPKYLKVVWGVGYKIEKHC